MRIVMATHGTTGDLQPFLALAVEFRRRGHEPLLAGPPNFSERTEKLDLEFVRLGPYIPEEETRRVFAPAYEMSGMKQQLEATLPFTLAHTEESVHQLMLAARTADVLLSFPYQSAGQITAELLGLPFVSVHFSPFGIGRRPKLATIAASEFNSCRAVFGLDPIDDPLGADGVSSLLALTAVSPHVFPRPAKWPQHNHLTGFWFLDEPCAQVDPAIVEFVEGGEPPVVIGFGSIMHRDPAALTAKLVDAARITGLRTVIQSGWSGLNQDTSLPNVMFAPFVPHSWLFPRASCIVHAGGAGTMAAALRAGTPMVFVPHWMDQPLWGALARERQFASRAIPLRDLTAEALAAAIQTATSSPEIRQASQEASRVLRAENGPSRAADLIESLVSNSRSEPSPDLKKTMMTQPVDVSLVVFTPPEDTAAIHQGRLTTEVLLCQPPSRAADSGSQGVNTRHVALPQFAPPADRKNIAWRSARGRWVLFLPQGSVTPPLEPLGTRSDVEVVCPATTFCPGGWPLLHPPFAIQRQVLEELCGFDDLPCNLEDVDLGIRLQLVGAKFLCTEAWTPEEPAPCQPLRFEDVLALFYRHPYRWILRWACDQVEEALGAGEIDEDLETRFARIFRRPVPARCLYGAMEIADIIAARATPPLLGHAGVTRALDGAVEAGLYTAGPSGDRRFDRHHTVNWICANSRHLEAAFSRTCMHRHPPPSLLQPSVEPFEVEVEGRHEVILDREAIAELKQPTLSFPLPATTPEQHELRLFDLEPPELDGYVDPASSVVRQFPLVVPREGPLRLGYSFRCRTREGTISPADPPEACPSTPLAARHQAALDAVIESIFEGRAPPPESTETARAIYGWLLHHIESLESDRMGLFALDARAGNCVHRTRLFELLCERVGIRVRNRCGLLGGVVTSTGSSETGPFMTAEEATRGMQVHRWCEVSLPGRGWYPIDLMGITGRRVLTPRSIRDPMLRQWINEWTPLLERYYFGKVDPYRIYLSEVPSGFLGIPAGQKGSRDPDMIRRTAWGTRHHLKLTFRDLPPTTTGTLPRLRERI